MPPLLEKWYRRVQSYFTTIFSWNCRERSSKTKLYSEHVFAQRTVSAVNPELHRMCLENRHTNTKNCCSENLTLNLQTIFQKCESTNPSHSHLRLRSLNLYGHRNGTQTPHRRLSIKHENCFAVRWQCSPRHHCDAPSHGHTYHLTILQKIDCHLYSTLESDLLHIVSVWYRPCHAYFKIASPSRQLHPDKVPALSLYRSPWNYPQLCFYIWFAKIWI